MISVAVRRAAGHMDTTIAYHDITYMYICAAGHSNITTSDCIVHQNISDFIASHGRYFQMSEPVFVGQ